MSASYMTASQALLNGRESFDRKAWAESYRLLQAADRDVPLEPEDLERLAIAAYLVAQDDDCEAFTARAHQSFLDRGDREGAARAAFWLGFALLGRGAMAPAAGWLARAERVLDEGQLDCVVRGYLLIPAAIQRIVQGDPTASHSAFTQAADIASRFGDRSLLALARHGRGRALIHLGRIAEGVTLLDEAMVSVIAGDVMPVLAGDIYCSVLEGCQEIFDLPRAHDWTTSLARWCATQPDLVRYRGECLTYRAEIMQWRGNWNAAEQDARADAEELRDIANALGTPLLGAISAQATGAVLLAEGDLVTASTSLRQACETLRDLDTPYEEAQTRLLMAVVCERRGDQDGCRLDLDAARRLFEQLKAEPSLARMEQQFGRSVRQRPGLLSERELQVLRLLAAGKTNRAIAEELFISEKTVARHVSNIFDKVGASSRSGATAWAFQHNLI